MLLYVVPWQGPMKRLTAAATMTKQRRGSVPASGSEWSHRYSNTATWKLAQTEQADLPKQQQTHLITRNKGKTCRHLFVSSHSNMQKQVSVPTVVQHAEAGPGDHC